MGRRDPTRTRNRPAPTPGEPDADQRSGGHHGHLDDPGPERRRGRTRPGRTRPDRASRQRRRPRQRPRPHQSPATSTTPSDPHGANPANNGPHGPTATTAAFRTLNPLVEPSWAQIAAMGYQIRGIGLDGGDVVAGSWTRSTPPSPGPAGRTHRGGHRNQPGDPPAQQQMRRFIHRCEATDASAAAPATPNAANPTMSSPTPKADPPHPRTGSRWVNTTTGSNTKLGADHDPGRELHLPTPTPPVRHPPHQPPRARCLSRWLPWRPSGRQGSSGRQGEARRSGSEQ